MKLGYSMQDWFLRICFAPSCAGEGDGVPIAEMHTNLAVIGDFDVVVNSKWLSTASADEVRAVLLHECTHAVENFIQQRLPQR